MEIKYKVKTIRARSSSRQVRRLLEQGWELVSEHPRQWFSPAGCTLRKIR